MPDEAQIWQGVNLPANFTPMMVLGNNVLDAGAHHRSRARRPGRRARVRSHRRPGSLDGAEKPDVPERDPGHRRLHRQPGRRAADDDGQRPMGWAPAATRRACWRSGSARSRQPARRVQLSSVVPARSPARDAGRRSAGDAFIRGAALPPAPPTSSRALRHSPARAGRRRCPAAISAADWIVKSQAQTMLPATPQRTPRGVVDRADADDRAGDRVRGRHRDAEARSRGTA